MFRKFQIAHPARLIRAVLNPTFSDLRRSLASRSETLARPQSVTAPKSQRLLYLFILALTVAALSIAYQWFMQGLFFSYALVNQDQIFRAICDYAAHHEQMTPDRLQELIPTYFDSASLGIMADERAESPILGKIEYLYAAKPLPRSGFPDESITILKRYLGNGDIIESSVKTGTIRRKSPKTRG